MRTEQIRDLERKDRRKVKKPPEDAKPKPDAKPDPKPDPKAKK